MISRTQFDEECRSLWRDIAKAYANDGHYPDKMRLWADQAVSDYKRKFEANVVDDAVYDASKIKQAISLNLSKDEQ